jgi:hypothetical protein
MANFWTFGIRVPAAVLAAVSAALGASGAFDWSIAWTGALLCAFVAYLAGIFGRQSQARQRVRAELAQLQQRPRLRVIHGLKEQRGSLDRAA